MVVSVDLLPGLTALALVLSGAAVRSPAAALLATFAAVVVGAIGLVAGAAVFADPDLQAAPGAALAVSAGVTTLVLGALAALPRRQVATHRDPTESDPKGALRHG